MGKRSSLPYRCPLRNWLPSPPVIRGISNAARRSAWFIGALLVFNLYAVFASTLCVVPPAGQGVG
jgi:hypothetical protein